MAVVANTASQISPVPSSAATRGSCPRWRKRKMFSSTRMALLTNIPTEMASPRVLIMFMVMAFHFMNTKVPMMAVGMVRATRVMMDMRWKKRKRVRAV
ncbi:MAG: hypothetical protein BWY88_00983 [Synergistetes bacterium ADurb.Bin520]|nr:MAG: hypothetical protein BWY88_00983 [Synergistetes bacterium ADurb.Bin520]